MVIMLKLNCGLTGMFISRCTKVQIQYIKAVDRCHYVMYRSVDCVRVKGTNLKDHPNLTLKKSKVKCTLVQALRLCTGHTAHRGSRGMALPFHDHGARRG